MRRPIRPWLRVPRRRRPAAARPKGGILLPVLIGIGLAVAVIVLIDAALRPTVTELAKAKVKNAVTSIINDAVNETLSSEAISYGDLVTLGKDTAGQVTVLAANTAQLNALRTEILGRILEQVEQLDSQELGIPLGSLTGFATASDLGPVLPVRVLTAATPTAAFEHVFTSSGINQTLHQVMLNVQVECTLLIPGGAVDTVVEAQVCAAETLLVGQVPCNGGLFLYFFSHQENQMAIQRTLSIIKPDAVAKNVIGQIYTRFENAGLKIVAAQMRQLSRAEAEGFYAVHKERPFFNDLVNFMTSGPVMIQVLEGEDAIAKNRQLMGATDPKKAEKGTIRADFAESIDANAVHGSDAPETAAVEVAYFFPTLAICSR